MREVISNEWFTILIVLCLAVLAVAKFAYNKRFSDFISVIGNSKYLKIYARDQKFIDQFDALLFINLIISSSIPPSFTPFSRPVKTIGTFTSIFSFKLNVFPYFLFLFSASLYFLFILNVLIYFFNYIQRIHSFF